jgi:hypothetical protein
MAPHFERPAMVAARPFELKGVSQQPQANKQQSSEIGLMFHVNF